MAGVILPTNRNFRNLTGQQFGRLTVLEYAGRRNKRTLWLCQCECGNLKTVQVSSLDRGTTLSCGCLRRSRPWRHGGVGTREYACWCDMKGRCRTPTHSCYADYGGRGIRVCAGWADSFAHFKAVMGPRPSPAHSLERIDNGRGYECGECEECRERGVSLNCRWATMAEQNRNRRGNHLITHGGVTLCLMDWAHRLGIKFVTLDGRLRTGWTVERAFTTPVKHKRGYVSLGP